MARRNQRQTSGRHGYHNSPQNTHTPKIVRGRDIYDQIISSGFPEPRSIQVGIEPAFRKKKSREDTKPKYDVLVTPKSITLQYGSRRHPTYLTYDPPKKVTFAVSGGLDRKCAHWNTVRIKRCKGVFDGVPDRYCSLHNHHAEDDSCEDESEWDSEN